MMKLALIFACICIGVAVGKPIEDAKVHDEYQELGMPQELAVPNVKVKEVLDHFLALVDKPKLAKFIVGKLRMDPSAQAVFRYLRGEKVKIIVAHIMNDAEYTKLIRWFHDNGFTNIYTNMNRLCTFFGWGSKSETNVPAVVVDEAFAKSLQTLAGELMEVVPLNAMAELALELSGTDDPGMSAILTRFREPGMGEAWRRLKLLPEVQELGQAMMEGSAGLEIFLVIIEAFLGW